jgi:hypothetical protein
MNEYNSKNQKHGYWEEEFTEPIITGLKLGNKIKRCGVYLNNNMDGLWQYFVDDNHAFDFYASKGNKTGLFDVYPPFVSINARKEIEFGINNPIPISLIGNHSVYLFNETSKMTKTNIFLI